MGIAGNAWRSLPSGGTGSILGVCQGTTFEPVEAPMRSNIFRKLRLSVAMVFFAAVAGGALVGPAAAQQSMAGSASDKSRPVLFYCMTDCWMSWNAAKRAVEWGYGSVIWYPLGTDGWENAKLPLEENRPYTVDAGPTE